MNANCFVTSLIAIIIIVRLAFLYNNKHAFLKVKGAENTFGKVQLERLKRLRKHCRDSHSELFWMRRVNRTTEFRTCLIEKSASTTMLAHLHTLLTPEEKINQAREKKFNRTLFKEKFFSLPAADNDVDIIKLGFTFVRHPFDRLVSAYYDKFQKYPIRINRREKKFRFRGFIAPRALVRYVQNQRKFRITINRHIRPQNELCNFCRIDFLGKLETMKRDFDGITQLLGLKSLWSNKIKENARAKKSKKTHFCEFFSFLKRKDIEFLKRFYREDFLLFNYEGVEILQRRCNLTLD